MKKQIIIILVSLLMVFTGCGKKTTEKSEPVVIIPEHTNNADYAIDEDALDKTNMQYIKNGDYDKIILPSEEYAEKLYEKCERKLINFEEVLFTKNPSQKELEELNTLKDKIPEVLEGFDETDLFFQLYKAELEDGTVLYSCQSSDYLKDYISLDGERYTVSLIDISGENSDIRLMPVELFTVFYNYAESIED